MCSWDRGYRACPRHPDSNTGRVTPVDPFSPNTDELLGNNARFVESYADQGLPLSPRRHLAIVACMDSRMDIFQMLGLDQVMHTSSGTRAVLSPTT